MHVRLAKPERPSVRILAHPKLNKRTGNPSGHRRVLKDTLRPIRQGGETVGWDVFFRVNEPERRYYLGVRAVWKRVPGDVTKADDSRAAAFVEKYGDLAVELDALPVEELQARIRASVEEHMDVDALEGSRALEREQRERLADLAHDLADDWRD